MMRNRAIDSALRLYCEVHRCAKTEARKMLQAPKVSPSTVQANPESVVDDAKTLSGERFAAPHSVGERQVRAPPSSELAIANVFKGEAGERSMLLDSGASTHLVLPERTAHGFCET